MPDPRPRRHRARASAALVLIALAVLPVGCSRQTDIPAEIEAQIETYRKEPSDARQSRIEASFAKLDAEIAEMRADAGTATGNAKEDALAKADALSARASELRKRWYGARFAAARDAAKNAVKQLGVTIGAGIESAGQKMKDAVAGDDTKGDAAAGASDGTAKED